MAHLEIKPFVRPPPPTHSFRLTGSIDRPAFIKNILDSQLILKTSYPATTRHYLISSTFMPHSSPNSLLTKTTPGSPHTSKHLKLFPGTSSMFTSAPPTPHLEPKPSPISNQPLIDTINLSLLPNRNTTLHSFTAARGVYPFLRPLAQIPPQSHRASLFYGVRFQSMGKLQAPEARTSDS